MKIMVATSAHPAEDPRIRYKEVSTLVDAGYNVELLHFRGVSNDQLGNLTITGFTEHRNRFTRFFRVFWVVVKEVFRKRPDVLHIHDPDLLPLLPLARMLGIRTIYDSHEYFPCQIYTKQWIPKYLRKPLSVFFGEGEMLLAKCATYLIVATPKIQQRFHKLGRSYLVRNFPRLDLFDIALISETRGDMAYVGGVSKARGLIEMIEVARRSKVKLHIAGRVDAACFEVIQQAQVDGLIKYHGVLSGNEVVKLLSRCRIGLCLLQPEPNYLDALPTKLFEYFAMKMPAVVSDFPLWKNILKDSGAGFALNPTDIDGVVECVNRLIADTELADKMGEQGRKYVEENCSWENERLSLLTLYNAIEKQIDFPSIPPSLT